MRFEDIGILTESELREYADEHFGQIAQLLSRVDRQMLLVFKNNHQLRFIHFSLGTSEEVPLSTTRWIHLS
jgi:hypothetical protein